MSYCCPKCGKPLSPSDVEGYPFVCHECDENFYQFEAVWKEETGFKCPKCGNTESFDADIVILMGTTHITPDGWNYFDYPNDVMLDDGAMLTCCECGYQNHAGRFEES